MSSIPLKAGAVTVAHANSDKNGQIFMAAKAIWGIESNKLPQAKFAELKGVLEGHLTRQYGPYKVESKPLGLGNVFVISMDQEVLEASYQSSPCSLDICMTTKAALKCSRCREAIYCCKDHQIQDWPRHKVECIKK